MQQLHQPGRGLAARLKRALVETCFPLQALSSPALSFPTPQPPMLDRKKEKRTTRRWWRTVAKQEKTPSLLFLLRLTPSCRGRGFFPGDQHSMKEEQQKGRRLEETPCIVRREEESHVWALDLPWSGLLKSERRCDDVDGAEVSEEEEDLQEKQKDTVHCKQDVGGQICITIDTDTACERYSPCQVSQLTSVFSRPF